MIYKLIIIFITFLISVSDAGDLVQCDQLGVMKLKSPLVVSLYSEVCGDPAILQDNKLNRIYFTTPNIKRLQGAIGEATSEDLKNWKQIGVVLNGNVGRWNEQLETPYCIKPYKKYYLFYCGYPKIGWPVNPGQIGCAVSDDGTKFQHRWKPALTPTPNWYDANGLYSPIVVKVGTEYLMIYCGHCYESNLVTPGIYLLSAKSKDIAHWTKNQSPVLSPDFTVNWMMHGVSEPAIVKVSDGLWYLFFTANLGDEQNRCIAVARSKDPLGPYNICKQPILYGTPGWFDEQGVLAPHVIISGKKLKIWYLTSNFGETEKHSIGYAEMAWPLPVGTFNN